MAMKTYLLKGENLNNWKSFHNEFRAVMKFPDYYGENMDAWIDCVDELTMDTQTVIHIDNGKLLKETAPDILEAVLECAAFVNFRKIEAGDSPTLIMSISV
jgi:RNAse (barnase) inhibitor barstar